MKDPVVLITGALTGIGRATALAFANEGGRIVASIAEISRLATFRTPSYFTTVVRDGLGVTPEAYRAAAVQEARARREGG